MKTTSILLLLLSVFFSCLAQAPTSDLQQFIRVEAPVIALTHVRVIDGTGAAPLEDHTIVISDGKIQSIAPTANAKVQSNVQILDLKGYTVLPGLIGMHDSSPTLLRSLRARQLSIMLPASITNLREVLSGASE